MSKITMEFARQDDCLDKMVPSDLRLLVGERDALSAQVEVLRRSILKAYNHQLNVGYDNQRGVSEVFSLLGDAFLLAQATPTACLAQVRAEAGRAGFIAGARALETIQILASGESIGDLAEAYAERIQQGGDA